MISALRTNGWRTFALSILLALVSALLWLDRRSVETRLVSLAQTDAEMSKGLSQIQVSLARIEEQLQELRRDQHGRSERR